MKNYRPTRAEVNLQSIYDNYENVKRRCPGKDVIAVVKADAYGHGAIEVVRHLRGKGVRYFAVSLLEEALELRECFTDIDILIMGVIEADDLSLVEKHNLEFTISEVTFAEQVFHYDGELSFHLKIDTGMNRMGFKDIEEVINFMHKISTKACKHLTGIYTHFATSDSNQSFYDQQLMLFKETLNKLPYVPAIVHVSNTSSAIKYEEKIEETTHIRIGLSLYGLSSEGDAGFLKPAMRLKTQIIQIKDVRAMEYIGYGITYQAKEDERIGILPIGYADGLIRKNQNGDVEINQQRFPIVGRVCMDYTFVKIDDSINLGDWVTLFGGDVVTTYEFASRLDSIPYEIICLISKRVPRIYTH